MKGRFNHRHRFSAKTCLANAATYFPLATAPLLIDYMSQATTINFQGRVFATSVNIGIPLTEFYHTKAVFIANKLVLGALDALTLADIHITYFTSFRLKHPLCFVLLQWKSILTLPCGVDSADAL